MKDIFEGTFWQKVTDPIFIDQNEKFFKKLITNNTIFDNQAIEELAWIVVPFSDEFDYVHSLPKTLGGSTEGWIYATAVGFKEYIKLEFSPLALLKFEKSIGLLDVIFFDAAKTFILLVTPDYVLLAGNETTVKKIIGGNDIKLSFTSFKDYAALFQEFDRLHEKLMKIYEIYKRFSC